MAILTCEEETCIHNTYGLCGKGNVHLNKIESNEFRDGRRQVYTNCTGYAEVKYAGTD